MKIRLCRIRAPWKVPEGMKLITCSAICRCYEEELRGALEDF
ncbi:MAG: hypothetical protein ACXVHR_07770 [Methanobacterium sp.]